ncbi:inner membrane translocase Oxa101 [Schizosaccharomyces cryophilus OY26]|uniref:Inner membrane translocase Oxa101 n=1 Tax=Schizosaccharomyces cryophilus (strain OY26 / ATCC MYA-4695 / CBS 11777 / NBRC 106824 / NRRL Y48691) TaxID=653667 RepID=S9W0V1_SCHCR|nr:inner membrane translocase Oxa101 [Schizosaccharomyces cryophilus OY26]EPY51675.1 inner membrane translocase Oxa101 [Schizosaccharomyces cryophilus OY26]
MFLFGLRFLKHHQGIQVSNKNALQKLKTLPVRKQLPLSYLQPIRGVSTSVADTAVAATTNTANAVGISNSWWPYAFLQNAAYTINVYAGAPWWVSIIATTIGVRFALLPLMLKSFRTSSKLSVLQPEMKKELDAIKSAKLENDQMRLTQHSMALRALYIKHQINPLSIFMLPLTQSVVFFSFFYAIRQMARVPAEGFKEGGCAWFQDLSAADPYYILPMINAAFMFTGMQLNRSNTASTIGNSPNWSTFFFLCCLLSPLFTIKLPSAIFLYWIPSSIFNIVQGFILKRPAVRQKLGFAPLPPSLDSAISGKNLLRNPFKAVRDMYKGIKDSILGRYDQLKIDMEKRALATRSVNVVRPNDHYRKLKELNRKMAIEKKKVSEKK